VLVDHARRRDADKRGGGARDVPLEDAPPLRAEDAHLFLALNDALVRLEEQDERQAVVIQMHYFVGLTIREMADVMDLSRSTVKRDLRSARAWLASELQPVGES